MLISLVHLAHECELGLKPTKEALLAVMMNKKDVESKLFLVVSTLVAIIMVNLDLHTY